MRREIEIESGESKEDVRCENRKKMSETIRVWEKK